MNTVRQYRKAGYKVRVTHLRKIHCSDTLYSMWELKERGLAPSLLSTGGRTIVEIKTVS